MIMVLVSFLLLAPLIGAILNGLRWRRENIKPAVFIGAGACFLSFLSAIGLFFCLKKTSSDLPYITVSFFKWLNVDFLKVSFAFLIDPVSMLMLLIITGVGFLIHIFSAYYMSSDRRPAKYFSYLNLFLFSMMILVLGDNLFLMFLGWEGVGLCSYLLIGFWFKDLKKASAGMKAFIVNRIGDMGFLLGMFILFQQFLTLNFNDLSKALSTALSTGAMDLTSIKWAGFFLFMGAVGKSAQLPLYIWLPSAMAGPTPVSALIHAATMVTAGVYLIVRMDFLFIEAGEVLTLICWTGGVTAFLTALIASAQSDIKKVLAYSTISQLGYMFVALGLTAFTTGLFHLMTHAFFKALLFLSAGALIHALKGEQNIYRMGGLKKPLPLTYISFMVGFLALIGLPPFSGFFSKDEILWSAFSSGHFGVFALSLLTALLTAFYMTRLMVLVFYGKSFKESHSLKYEEKGFSFRFPLIILAVLSLFGGLLGIPHLIGEHLPVHIPHLLEMYLKPVVFQTPFKGSLTIEFLLMAGSTLLILLVVGITRWLYLSKTKWLEVLKQKNQAVFKFFESELKVAPFCHSRIVQPVLNISHELWQGGDEKLLKGLILLLQKGVISLKTLFESLQKGHTQNYILFMVLGLLVCILATLVF